MSQGFKRGASEETTVLHIYFRSLSNISKQQLDIAMGNIFGKYFEWLGGLGPNSGAFQFINPVQFWNNQV